MGQSAVAKLGDLRLRAVLLEDAIAAAEFDSNAPTYFTDRLNEWIQQVADVLAVPYPDRWETFTAPMTPPEYPNRERPQATLLRVLREYRTRLETVVHAWED
jgi:hypothetical protein